ncbi:hypothetical protein E2650_05195 [Shewanella xiamenensis]|uniref:Uncharacterized protein n=1 Tax=Shewanella xiamenensis TaxID=332186 RepID=A0AAW6QUE9_9GAMM|nr:hypothetical protein [Shewanella xiamenensis]MDG5899306.1 hypothetical protein [Shewanella xiamenensis]
MALRYQLPDAVTLYYSQVLVVGGYRMNMAPLSAVATIFHNDYGHRDDESLHEARYEISRVWPSVQRLNFMHDRK